MLQKQTETGDVYIMRLIRVHPRFEEQAHGFSRMVAIPGLRESYPSRS